MTHERNPSDDRLDALLHAEASDERSRTDARLADRLIARLDTAPRRASHAPATLAAGLGIAAIAVAAITRTAPDHPHQTPAPLPPVSIATTRTPPIDPRIPAAIDHAADELLQPLRTEIQALTSISRDSWRNLAGFLSIGG